MSSGVGGAMGASSSFGAMGASDVICCPSCAESVSTSITESVVFVDAWSGANSNRNGPGASGTGMSSGNIL